MSQLDFAAVLAGIKPKTRTVRVCLRGDLLAEHASLEEQLLVERRADDSENRHAQAPAIAVRIQQLEEQISQAAVEFTFRSVGQRAWTDLLAEHKPAAEDREEGYEFDPRTFPQAALALSATAPTMTVEQAQQLFEALNFGQWQTLWRACLTVNVEAADVPFSHAASVILHGSEMKSGRQATTELPEASSSDE